MPNDESKDYKIKQIVSDFFVEEVPGYEMKEDGEFLVYKLTKENITTFDAVNQISEVLHIPSKDIGYSGLKDKNATTVQYITIKRSSNRKFENDYMIGKIRLEQVGYRDEKLFPGCLESNNFEIVVRKINSSISSPKKIKKMINLFGEQRFSSNNVEIGRKLLKRNFKDAIELISETDESIPELTTDKTNYINVLQRMNQKVLSLYAHAFQSYVWNNCAWKIMKIVEDKTANKKINLDEISIPLIGFDVVADGIVNEVIESVLNDEQIKLRDLVVRELPRISLEGGSRKLLVDVKNLKISKLSDDELNPGTKKCTVAFNLSKGSYGTECIKQLFLS